MDGLSSRHVLTSVYNIISKMYYVLSGEIHLGTGNTGVLKMLLKKRPQVVLNLGKLGNPLRKQCSF